MKLNKKIIVPAFALLVGASLAGSVSGTIAWYQYSTRANVSYIGSSAGTIGNLQVRIKGAAGRAGEWGTQIETDDVLSYLAAQSIGQHVEPVTPGNLAKNGSLKHGNWKEMAAIPYGADDPDTAGADTSKKYLQIDGISPAKLFKYENSAWAEDTSIDLEDAVPDVDAAVVGDQYINLADKKLYEKELADNDFYLNPIFGVGPYNKWLKASLEDHYVRIPLQFQFIGKDAQDLSGQSVYLTKLLIQKDTGRDANAADHGDISEAVRVHFSAYEDGDEDNAVNRLVSKKGGTTLTNGYLKLGGGDDFDKAYAEGDEWGFDGSSYSYVTYGAGKQVSYAALSDASEGYYYNEEAPASGWKANALLSGAIAPQNTGGNNGDFYYDTAESKLYKKDAGVWTEFTDFVSGVADPDLDTENPNDYDYYFKTGENKLFLRVAPTHENIDPILVKQSADNPLVLQNLSGKELGATVPTVAAPNPQKYLNVDVTIWVEGWHKFNNGGNYSSLWNQDLIGAMFDVGMQFAVQDIHA